MLAESLSRRFPPVGAVRVGALTGFYNRDFGVYDPELEAVQANVSASNRPSYPRRVDIIAERIFVGGIFKLDPAHNEAEAPYLAKFRLRKKYNGGELQGNLRLNDISEGRRDDGMLLIVGDVDATVMSVQVSPADGRGIRYRVKHVGTRDEEQVATAFEALLKVAEAFAVEVEF